MLSVVQLKRFLLHFYSHLLNSVRNIKVRLEKLIISQFRATLTRVPDMGSLDVCKSGNLRRWQVRIRRHSNSCSAHTVRDLDTPIMFFVVARITTLEYDRIIYSLSIAIKLCCLQVSK